MSRASDTCEDRLPLAAAKQINAMCNRFELAWQAGQRPQIEDYLADAPEPLRSALVRELVALEIAYRRRAGEEPTAAEYRVRFPTLSLATLLTDPAGPGRDSGPGDVAALPAVPGYELLQELGRGGMGVVYLARQGALDRTVALKMILAGGHAGPADRDRFRTEGEAIARLQHPNIVQIHEVGEHDGLPFFSLEFCPGGSLERKLAGTPLPSGEAAALVGQLARAMQAAHDKGVIHRDLKPANILLAEDGTPKITDFGLAKKLEEVGQTQSGAVMGTPSYMAPEQAGGKRKVGPAADVYALGA